MPPQRRGGPRGGTGAGVRNGNAAGVAAGQLLLCCGGWVTILSHWSAWTAADWATRLQREGGHLCLGSLCQVGLLREGGLELAELPVAGERTQAGGGVVLQSRPSCHHCRHQAVHEVGSKLSSWDQHAAQIWWGMETPAACVGCLC